MAENKEIRIGVDASGVKQYENTVRQSNETLQKSIENLARTSGRVFEQNKKTLFEEIALLEKRNRLLYEKQTGRATSEYNEARSYVSYTARTPEEAQRRTSQAFTSYQGQMAGVGTDYQQSKEQTKLLRELIETVKAASKDEVRQESVNNDELRSTVIGGEVVSDGRKPNLKEQKQEEASFKSGGKRLLEMGTGAVEARSGLDLASKGVTGAAGMFEGIGGIGGVIGMLAALTIGKVIGAVGESVAKYEGSLGEFSRYGGKGIKQMKGFDLDIVQMSKYGMTASEWFSNYTGLRAGAKTNNFGESATNLMNISKGTPVSQSDVTGLLSLKRYGGGNVSPEIAFFEKYLRKQGEDISVLPEIIQQFTRTATTVIGQTGKSDTTGIAKLLGGFGMQTGLTGDVLSSTFGKIEQGFHRSSNPVVQAMQFRAARQSGAKTVWEAEKIMESPLSNPQYMSTVLQSMKRVSGGGDQYERAISNVFGINPNLAGNVAQWDLSKGVTPDMLKTLKSGSVSYGAAAERTVGEVTASGKNLESTREVYGFKTAENIASSMTKVVDELRKMIDMFTKETGGDIKAFKERGEHGLEGLGYIQYKKENDKLKEVLSHIDVSTLKVAEEVKKLGTDGVVIKYK